MIGLPALAAAAYEAHHAGMVELDRHPLMPHV